MMRVDGTYLALVDRRETCLGSSLLAEWLGLWAFTATD